MRAVPEPETGYERKVSRMIDFQTVTVNLTRQQLDVERRLGGGSFQGNFKSTGTMAGSRSATFTSRVNRVESAIKSFHFETKNDHHLEKLKLEPFVSFDDAARRVLNVRVEAAFKDDSPNDDFLNTPFIMTATILLIVDRQ